MRHGADRPGTDASPTPSLIDAAAQPTPVAGGAIVPPRRRFRMTLFEYEGRRVQVRPDLLKLEPLILEYLTDEQKRDGPQATIVKSEFASNLLCFDLDIDNFHKPQ